MVFGEAIWLTVVGAFDRYADAEVMDEAEEEACGKAVVAFLVLRSRWLSDLR